MFGLNTNGAILMLSKIDLTKFDNMPSIEDGKKEQNVVARIFIPYTINGWYIMGADKTEKGYNILAIEKWNTPFILKVKEKILSLSELLNKYDNIQYDENWQIIKMKDLSFIGCLK